MLRIILTTALLLLAGLAYSQQEAQYTQFMFNKLYYNPAYAGAKESLCFSAIYRNQWLGIDGAPQTATFNVHAPIWKKRMGLGLSVTNDQIGLSNRWNFDFNYAYRIALKNESTLSIGLRGSLSYMSIRWNDAQLTQTIDQSVPAGENSKMLPNFGAGVYYQARKWYVGFSIPRLFRNRIDFNTNNQATIEPELTQHYFLTGGVSIDIAKNVSLQPNVMLKYVPNTPFDADINLSVVFFEKVLFGVTYRVGDSVDGILQWRIVPQFTLSAAYDFTLTPLQSYNSGSFEVMVQYCLCCQKGKRLHNPRFF